MCRQISLAGPAAVAVSGCSISNPTADAKTIPPRHVIEVGAVNSAGSADGAAEGGTRLTNQNHDQCALRLPVARQGLVCPRLICWVEPVFPQTQHATTSTDQDRWQRIKKRLCFELGEDVFSSGFARVEFES